MEEQQKTDGKIRQSEGFKQKLIFNFVSKEVKRERGLVQVNDVNADLALFYVQYFRNLIFVLQYPK